MQSGTQENVRKLPDFVGYGTAGAPIWFLGMEESFVERPDFSYSDNLRLRCSFPEIIDVQEAHRQMKAEYWLRNRPVVSPVWHWMAKFSLALIHHDRHWFERDKVHEYIRHHLGRDEVNGGKTLLIELLPLPKSAVNSWPAPYQGLFKTRLEYENTVRPRRMKRLRELIEAHRPEYLFCYGKSNYDYYRELVGDSDWLEKPLSDTRFWIKKVGMTKLVLSPFFGNGALSKREARELIQYFKVDDPG